MGDEQGAGDQNGVGIVSSTLMIERREQLDDGLAPLLSGLPGVTRMVPGALLTATDYKDLI